ncbi:MAG: YqiA/YcfP family alpha/beta fold hydrolase [Candidatus Kapaibacterium sp.]
MKHIIYIHGYKGENSSKGKKLTEYFNSDEYKVHTPVQDPKSPHNTINSILMLIEELGSQSVFIVGSSRGGFYGLRIVQLTNVPCLLINPALNFSQTNYDNMLKQDGKEKTERVFKEIIEIRERIVNEPLDQSKINLFISTNDEILDHTELIQFLDNPRSIEMFEDTHKFYNFSETLPKVKAMVDSIG